MIFPEVHRYAVVSTGMMSLLDMKTMQFDARNPTPGSPIIYEYPEGFWVYCASESDDFEGYSDNVKKIIEDARKQEITYIQFDRDGPQIEGLKVHDW